MSDKQRIQVNVTLSAGQKQQLDILASHYGGVSTAIRIGLDALWREYIRSGQIRPAVADLDAKDADSGAGAQVDELDV